MVRGHAHTETHYLLANVHTNITWKVPLNRLECWVCVYHKFRSCMQSAMKGNASWHSSRPHITFSLFIFGRHAVLMQCYRYNHAVWFVSVSCRAYGKFIQTMSFTVRMRLHRNFHIEFVRFIEKWTRIYGQRKQYTVIYATVFYLFVILTVLNLVFVCCRNAMLPMYSRMLFTLFPLERWTRPNGTWMSWFASKIVDWLCPTLDCVDIKHHATTYTFAKVEG